MSISKKSREIVYQKLGGHCSYCGKKIQITEMQVDHQAPKNHWSNIVEIEGGYENTCDRIENLFPACRRCNHYKGAFDLERFRIEMRTIHERIQKQYITKVGVDFGIVKIAPFDGVFYFEKICAAVTSLAPSPISE